RQDSLLGEPVSIVGEATIRDIQWIAIVSLILLMTYLIDAAIEGWLKGDPGTRRKALGVTLAITLPLLGSLIYAQLVVFVVAQAPLSTFPWFLGTCLWRGGLLARDFASSAATRLEAAELRSILARVERTAILGQLASALAHELTQPLQA